jgi:hypothetical protein
MTSATLILGRLAGLLPMLAAGDDYDADPSDQSQAYLVVLLPVGLVVLAVIVVAVLIRRSRREPPDGGHPTPGGE